MNIVKKILLFNISVFLVVILLLTSLIWTLNGTIANRETVKGWLDDSGTYQNFVTQAVAVLQEEMDNEQEEAENGENNLEVDTETLRRVATNAFPPEFLKTGFEAVIDGSYNWIEGDTPEIQFNIDFSEAKTGLAQGVKNEVISRAEELPSCTTLPNQFEDFDVFSAVCVPPGFNIVELANEFEQQFANNEEFLPDPILSADEIKIGDSNNSDEEEKSIAEISRTDLKDVPNIYANAKNATWVVVVVAAVSLILILFLSKSRYYAVKHIAKVFIVAAFIIGCGTFIGQNAEISFETNGSGMVSASDNFGENIGVPIIEEAVDSASSYGYLFTSIYAAIFAACIAFIIFTLLRKKPGEQSFNAVEESDKLPAPHREAEPKNKNDQVKPQAVDNQIKDPAKSKSIEVKSEKNSKTKS